MTGDAHRGESGFTTLWVLGLCVMVLFAGGVSLDLWRGFSTRRAVAGVVDAAASAGASGLDEEALRREESRLDPEEAERLARASIESQPEARLLVSYEIEVAPDGSRIAVAGEAELPMTLARILLGDQHPLRVRVTSHALPRRLE